MWVFLKDVVNLGCKRDLCLHLLGGFTTKTSHYSSFLPSLSYKKNVIIFVFFEILVSNIFENISKSPCFLCTTIGKVMISIHVSWLICLQSSYIGKL